MERPKLSTQNAAPTRGKRRRSVEEERRVGKDEVALALAHSVDTIFWFCCCVVFYSIGLKFFALLDAIACGIHKRGKLPALEGTNCADVVLIVPRKN